MYIWNAPLQYKNLVKTQKCWKMPSSLGPFSVSTSLFYPFHCSSYMFHLEPQTMNYLRNTLHNFHPRMIKFSPIHLPIFSIMALLFWSENLLNSRASKWLSSFSTCLSGTIFFSTVFIAWKFFYFYLFLPSLIFPSSQKIIRGNPRWIKSDESSPPNRSIFRTMNKKFALCFMHYFFINLNKQRVWKRQNVALWKSIFYSFSYPSGKSICRLCALQLVRVMTFIRVSICKSCRLSKEKHKKIDFMANLFNTGLRW